MTGNSAMVSRRNPSTLGLLVLLTAAGLHAAAPDPKTPQGKNLEVPVGWTVRLDKPDPKVVIGSNKEAAIFFVNMTPGWHVTTGPSAIFYHPDSVASGESRIEAVIHLFEPQGRHREAFGIFFGGAGLEGEKQAYDYFVIRNSGEFLIKRRNGSETPLLHPWTKSEAIVPHSEGKTSVKNVLAVEAGSETVRFFINGEQVATLPRSEVRLDGIVGLRVNHHVNLHVEDLSIRPLPSK
ncbi:MAG TPA: hypothetical protein VMS98_14065 [Thermoanaerobaculia bacterium]|nr:hypothetical protein [Thermoanaerobaculia bacterium]